MNKGAILKKWATYHRTVIGLLEEMSNLFPNKTAMRDIEKSITYSELREKAANIGFSLNAILDGRTRVPLVIFMEKGCDCYCAMLEAVYSGSPYVPMDVKTPLERLQSILESLGEYAVVADDKHAKKLREIGYAGDIVSFELLMLQNADIDKRDATLKEIGNGVLDIDLMYILFTSGSTGVPKGVAITHRSVMDYVRAFDETHLVEADDVLGSQAPFYADLSLKDLYVGLSVGSTTCIIPQPYFMSPKRLLTFLDDNGVTMLMWVPTAYSIVSRFDALALVKPLSLKKILFSGEDMPFPVLAYWKRHYPDATFIQLYGPTEATGACTYYVLGEGDGINEGDVIPIGKPFSNTGLILLDEQNELINPKDSEAIGEICIYGSCLAAGYYNDDEKTRASFVAHPMIKTHYVPMYRSGDLAKYDGCGNLVFVSRKDYQIKHGGRRIELGEIEAGIYGIDGISMCCCVHNAKVDAIAALYVGDIDAKELRSALSKKLPQYMLPTIYKRLAELPHLNSGKLDRNKIKRMVEW